MEEVDGAPQAEKRRFDYRERTLMGFLGNARPRPPRHATHRQRLPPYAVHPAGLGQTRRELMLVRQALAKKALSDKQFGSRKARANKIRYIRDAQLATLSAAYDIQKQTLDLRHAEEIKLQKQEWRDLSVRRDQLWDEWRAEFGSKNGRAGRATAAKPAAAIRAAARPLPCPPANSRPTILPMRIESRGETKTADRFSGQKGIYAGGRA